MQVPGDKSTDQLKLLKDLSDKFADSITGAFSKGVTEGKKFDDVLKSIRQSLVENGLKLALAPLQSALSQSANNLSTSLFGNAGSGSGGLLDGLGKSLSSLLGSLFGGSSTALAKGGVLSGGMVMPFAQGGVVGAPTYFPLGSGLGLMGERGSEAVMPLARGPDGKLGVRGGGSGQPLSVTVNIATPDAQSFKRSEAQVSAALARAVARGQRGL